jgi:hypothetical protein
MKRRLLNLLTALSLLLFAAAVVLWVRSYWRYDQVNWFSADNGLCLASGDGVFAVMFGPNYKGPGAVQWPPGWRYRNYAALGPDGLPGQIQIASHRRLKRLNLAYDANRLVAAGEGPAYYSSHRFYFPHWLALLILAAVPASRAWRARRRRRTIAAGRCARCGYDLRATPGRCPECGTATSATGASE